MGSPCSLHFEDSNAKRMASAAANVLSELQRLERTYSRFLDDSLLCTINREAAVSGAHLPQEAEALINYAFTAHQVSGGVFDITSGRLSRLWNPARGRVPSRDEIEEALSVTGMDRLDWSPPVLRFRVQGMSLDLGGIVKEYAVDRATAICRQEGLTAGTVELGGDLAVLGPHADGSAWQIGIRDPVNRDRALASLPLRRGAMATSGDYERGFEVGGRRYSHLIDPRSGEPVEGSLSSVSVCASSCLVAGTASTSAMLLGEETGIAWLRDCGLSWLAVRRNGTLEHSGITTPISG